MTYPTESTRAAAVGPKPGFLVADGCRRFVVASEGDRSYCLHVTVGPRYGVLTLTEKPGGVQLLVSINGVSVYDHRQPFSVAEAWWTVASEELRARWVAAGLGALDLSAGRAWWDGWETDHSKHQTEDLPQVEREERLAWIFDAGFGADLPWEVQQAEESVSRDEAEGPLAFLNGKVTSTTRFNGGVFAYVAYRETCYIAIGNEFDGWLRWTADAPQGLAALPQVVDVLAAVGMTTWWVTDAPM